MITYKDIGKTVQHIDYGESFGVIEAIAGDEVWVKQLDGNHATYYREDLAVVVDLKKPSERIAELGSGGMAFFVPDEQSDLAQYVSEEFAAIRAYLDEVIPPLQEKLK